MPINAGKMRKQVRIEQRTTQPDAAGEPQVIWSLLCTARAQIERAAGAEVWSGNERSGRVPTVFTTRFRADVTVLPKMRLTCDGVLYDIKSAIDPDGMRAELELTCEELVEEPIE